MYADRKLSHISFYLSTEPRQLSKLASLPRNPKRTTQDLLITEKRILERRCGWEPEFTKNIQKKGAKWIAPKNCTALDLLKNSYNETKEHVDIPFLSLTEIVGPTDSILSYTINYCHITCLHEWSWRRNMLYKYSRHFPHGKVYKLMEIAKYRFPYIFGDENS
ncbi:16158_t:CDS:2 [Cetraspora pellucida]|uniref:16158_t:CDS:1 n=1 Tax=Cetraspora pellucida TaxID=1433469 RepID=A0ACA9MDR9_9GLOM|nr:16158_t:CDS:2 [Cetraspora pellucida]